MKGARVLYGHVTARFASTTARLAQRTRLSSQPLPGAKKEEMRGMFQSWRKPVYQAPIVHPLDVGCDFSFQDGRPVYVTTHRQLEKKLDDIRIGKKIVSLLAQVREIEEEHAKAETRRHTEGRRARRFEPLAKGDQRIS